MQTKFMLVIFTLIAFTSVQVLASEVNDTIPGKTDSLAKSAKSEKPAVLAPYHRNVIKLNPTPMLIWGEIRNFTLSYERLIRNNQSVSIQLGYLVIPLIFDTILNVAKVTDNDRQGINIALDYRYYPQIRNRRPAPDGMYIGGYLSYYGFSFQNKLDILGTENEHEGDMKGTCNMLNLGVELGYQFVFWKRFSVDLLMFGPSLSAYSRTLELTGNLTQADFENIDEEVAKKLVDRFPVLGYLFGGETATFSGSNVRISTGFRYSIQLGYHF